MNFALLPSDNTFTYCCVCACVWQFGSWNEGVAGQILTESGALSSTEVDPEAEAVRSPGMAIGSGDTVRLLRTAGASGLPQFFQSKP